MSEKQTPKPDPIEARIHRDRGQLEGLHQFVTQRQRTAVRRRRKAKRAASARRKK